MAQQTPVFDFAGMLFRWHPPTMIGREVPHLAPDDASAAHWAHAIFQGYAADWLDFDRGLFDQATVIERIVRRMGRMGVSNTLRAGHIAANSQPEPLRS